MSRTLKPPKCPRCEKPLQSVEVMDFDVWTFDPEKGGYMVDPMQSDIEQRCGKCNCDLSKLFPEGVVCYEDVLSR